MEDAFEDNDEGKVEDKGEDKSPEQPQEVQILQEAIGRLFCSRFGSGAPSMSPRINYEGMMGLLNLLGNGLPEAQFRQIITILWNGVD
jgi:hypothetical protein